MHAFRHAFACMRISRGGAHTYMYVCPHDYVQLFQSLDEASAAIVRRELTSLGDGQITGLAARRAPLEAYFREVDTDGDGEISIDELSAALTKSQTLLKVIDWHMVRELGLV